MTFVTILIGIVILIAGGELLVRYASRLALSVGLPPLVVGLTVVAFGTSAPELMASVYSQWIGEASVAMGNVVGSNIFNVFTILGLSALITPLAVDTRLIRYDVPVVIGVSLLVYGFAYSGSIARWEAGLLVGLLVIHVSWIILAAGSADADTSSDIADETELVAGASAGTLSAIALTLLGIGMVIGGGHLFVSGAVELAKSLGIEEGVIGLTVVAAGTSLPELVTSVLAGIRGHRDIAIGNVVGSNFFNLTGVLGIAGLVGPTELAVAPSVTAFDLPVMTAAAIACLPVMWTGGRIQRWEGAIFVAYYVGYVTFLVLEQVGSAAAPTFGAAMIWVVVPLTLLTLVVVGLRDHGSD